MRAWLETARRTEHPSDLEVTVLGKSPSTHASVVWYSDSTTDEIQSRLLCLLFHGPASFTGAELVA